MWRFPSPSLRRWHLALIIAGLLVLLIAGYSFWVHRQTALESERVRELESESALTLSLSHSHTQAGEGLVIYSDGLGYYAWLRSLLIDGDWAFDNEFDEHNGGGNGLPDRDRRTPLDRRCNQWSVGPACVWAAVVAPGHWLLTLLGAPWPADGYSLPYQLMVAAATLLVSFLGLGFLYGACRVYTHPERAALAAIWLTLGTPIIYYNAIEQSMAHGPATVVVALLVMYWLRTYGEDRRERWFLVGILVGAAALMRWQLATLAILPAGEALFGRKSEIQNPKSENSCGFISDFGFRISNLFRISDFVFRILNLPFAVAGALLAFLPQMIAWKCVYGSWFVSPLPVAPHWLTPDGFAILFSADRSLFYWTPLAGFAVIGAIFGSFGTRNNQPLRLLLLAFLLQVYVVASLWGRPAVYLGASFGMRHLTEALVLLGPGLAAMLDRASTRQLCWLMAIGWLLVLWNLLMVCQYRYGFLPKEAGASASTLAANALWIMKHRPWLIFSHVLALPLLTAHLLGRTTCPPAGNR